ncbi:hypothetical protein Bpfe_015441 [Biomphalaria pfeifferi]|uniref:DUF19 domain-containing protein n=1 Tax=Biomphalaria pfeifferi TaxID=112525 RepID=A0AAD8BIB0_BIOPF|nr:hypothetical protein Bpfe_015441 [Biomphalaria pfeifferi]
MKTYHLASALMCFLALPLMTFGCLEECMRKFTAEMSAFNSNETTNGTAQMTSSFCRLMYNHITCYYSAMDRCTPEVKLLVRSMLDMSIFPEYQRKCGGVFSPGTNDSYSQGSVNTSYGSVTTQIGTRPTSGRLLLICRERSMSCQSQFNNSVKAYDVSRNVSSLCQSLESLTLCYVNLSVSECGHLVNRNMLKAMQEQHGGMCSANAQANTVNMMECANKTIKCYSIFNSSFTPAVGDYNLMIMCSAIENYTKCMQEVSTTSHCFQFTNQTLTSISQLKSRHRAYCGDDNGQTAIRCAGNFQTCYSEFNKTFFPTLHSGDMSLMCNSLDKYSSCVSRLSPTCSQQLDQVVRSVQFMKLQFREQCHPKSLKLSNCSEVVSCSTSLMRNFSSILSSRKLCGTYSDYFQCVARGLEACKLPQSTTGIAFIDLGDMLQNYCKNISSNPKLIQCPAFVKCTTAVSMAFSPSIKSMFEGSTWCTYMQLNVGCAEHALQSSGCFLDEDVQLQKYIDTIDRTRMSTCGKEVKGSEVGGQHGNNGSEATRSLKYFLFVVCLLMLAVRF